jgi:hypothetical protein
VTDAFNYKGSQIRGKCIDKCATGPGRSRDLLISIYQISHRIVIELMKVLGQRPFIMTTGFAYITATTISRKADYVAVLNSDCCLDPDPLLHLKGSRVVSIAAFGQ